MSYEQRQQSHLIRIPFRVGKSSSCSLTKRSYNPPLPSFYSHLLSLFQLFLHSFLNISLQKPTMSSFLAITGTILWFFVGMFFVFSLILPSMASFSNDLNEIQYTIHEREINQPNRMHNLNGGVKRGFTSTSLHKRIVLHRKRDGKDDVFGSGQTKSNQTATSTEQYNVM